MGEIRQLISGLQRAAAIVLDHLFGWTLWRRIHQAVAKLDDVGQYIFDRLYRDDPPASSAQVADRS